MTPFQFEQLTKQAQILESETLRQLLIARDELVPRYRHKFELSTQRDWTKVKNRYILYLRIINKGKAMKLREEEITGEVEYLTSEEKAKLLKEAQEYDKTRTANH